MDRFFGIHLEKIPSDINQFLPIFSQFINNIPNNATSIWASLEPS